MLRKRRALPPVKFAVCNVVLPERQEFTSSLVAHGKNLL